MTGYLQKLNPDFSENSIKLGINNHRLSIFSEIGGNDLESGRGLTKLITNKFCSAQKHKLPFSSLPRLRRCLEDNTEIRAVGGLRGDLWRQQHHGRAVFNHPTGPTYAKFPEEDLTRLTGFLQSALERDS